ncbi:aminotransferase class V-fold PLP-dependent enzyme [Herbiconiux sp. CPCC 205763]|uniref:Aminotransferase class V-fold PLP-dependent enzyme n=1 Tax=Herbiconiux aconitum TaxID=2970913 RepID=A0ABT2GMM6_9MICO|nr:aminotransferase class V-fold PLP-dependent enzyme [Herbiconiux aconitum]MCS5717474.1 aminotransferase class V-fold PLP-dependent enzyme [Herbiconiux aconitum]
MKTDSPAPTAASMSREALAGHFDVRPGYLSACVIGVPPREAVAALGADLAAWAEGHREPGVYGAAVERAREAFARLVSVPTDQVAIGSQVSVSTSMVASSLPAGSEVLVVEGDFSSMVFPFLVQEQLGRLSVRCVPLEELAASIRPSTTLVSFSLVQSATGALADADAIIAAAARHGAATLCDTTQAAGWMPVDASRFDATICHAYKWLCSPRGASFMTITPAFAERLVPVDAGWYAGDDVWGSCYGPGMLLAESARRFDVSPAWPAWIGTAPTIELFASADLEAVRSHCVGLADELCRRLEVESTGTAIVTWPDADGSGFAALSAAGIAASARAGRARVAFHVWNEPADVDRALAALA